MFRKSLMALAIASLAAGSALAAVSADEAKQLGTTLTAVGAEKAGNKDGTIPEYTGGIKAPAGFQAGTTVRPDPFASEKPRLVITGKDVAAQADKLTEGTKELLKRYPTMRVDVYPTHRTVAVPQRVLDNTLKNATGAKTVDDGVALENVLAGYPFPIPKTGSEAIWNHLLRYSGLGYDGSALRELERRRGRRADARRRRPTRSGRGRSTTRRRRAPISASDPYWYNKLLYVGPARRNGEALLLDRRGQPAEAAAPRVAVPAGPAPREARARSRLRHAEPRRGRRGNVRRRVGVQRRDRPLRLEARRQEGDVRSVQQLPADLSQGPRRTSPSPTTSIRTSCAGSCTACGWSRRR